MRLLSHVLVLAFALAVLAVTARTAVSSGHGRDIWKVRLATSSSDRWILLDTGVLLIQGRPKSVFLLGHHDEDEPANHLDELKVEVAGGGPSLWDYDGTGSDFVDANGLGPEEASAGIAHLCSAPRLEDVDGDGSDDVLFVEQDFIFGRQLRAVRIAP